MNATERVTLIQRSVDLLAEDVAPDAATRFIARVLIAVGPEPNTLRLPKSESE